MSGCRDDSPETPLCRFAYKDGRCCAMPAHPDYDGLCYSHGTPTPRASRQDNLLRELAPLASGVASLRARRRALRALSPAPRPTRYAPAQGPPVMSQLFCRHSLAPSLGFEALTLNLQLSTLYLFSANSFISHTSTTPPTNRPVFNLFHDPRGWGRPIIVNYNSRTLMLCCSPPAHSPLPHPPITHRPLHYSRSSATMPFWGALSPPAPGNTSARLGV